MAEFEEKIEQLRDSQIETQTLVKGLTLTVSNHIALTESRLSELNTFRVDSSKLLAEAATTLRDVKVDVDRVCRDTVPNIDVRVAKVESASKITGWFVKGIVGLVIVGGFGGLLGSVSTCQNSGAVEAHSTQSKTEAVEMAR
jgi:hypothetical protein